MGSTVFCRVGSLDDFIRWNAPVGNAGHQLGQQPVERARRSADAGR
jgi:hypothetical protein